MKRLFQDKLLPVMEILREKRKNNMMESLILINMFQENNKVRLNLVKVNGDKTKGKLLNKVNNFLDYVQ